MIRANNAVQYPGASVSKTWRMLGLRMVKLQNADTRLMQSRYRGGMRVVDVRTGSTAESNGIRKGDILVGLHIWETVSTENISYVLNHPKFRTFSPLKFYILRGRNTLFGHLQISSGR